MSNLLPEGWAQSTSYSLQHRQSGWKIAMTRHNGVLSFDLWRPPADEGSREAWPCCGHFASLDLAVAHHDSLTGGSHEPR
ncbi:hypothetical protein [Chitinimonas taiwanensis]|uniref:hypothetical protein n=1 Tax=Chitinimonas taiwanensis TaxID=240412 RepID=UPI0035AF5A88